ncbi:hypothetical protein AAC387_Pa12g1123 [Persea americana]
MAEQAARPSPFRFRFWANPAPAPQRPSALLNQQSQLNVHNFVLSIHHCSHSLKCPCPEPRLLLPPLKTNSERKTEQLKMGGNLKHKQEQKQLKIRNLKQKQEQTSYNHT